MLPGPMVIDILVKKRWMTVLDSGCVENLFCRQMDLLGSLEWFFNWPISAALSVK